RILFQQHGCCLKQAAAVSVFRPPGLVFYRPVAYTRTGILFPDGTAGIFFTDRASSRPGHFKRHRLPGKRLRQPAVLVTTARQPAPGTNALIEWRHDGRPPFCTKMALCNTCVQSRSDQRGVLRSSPIPYLGIKKTEKFNFTIRSRIEYNFLICQIDTRKDVMNLLQTK